MSLSDKHLVAVKAESTYGQDAFGGSLPTEWLGVIGQPEINDSVQEIGPEELTANGLGGQILHAKDMTEVSFTTYLVGKEAAAGDPPPVLDELLKACNFAETIGVGVDAQYDLAFGRDMTATPSVTVYEAIRDEASGDYYVRVVTGVRLVATFQFQDGQDVRIQVEGNGKYAELATNTTSITLPTQYSGGKDRIKVQGMTFTFGGTAYGVEQVELGTGMSVDMDRDLTADASVDEVGLYLASGDKPGGSVNFSPGEWANIYPSIQPVADGPQSTGELVVQVADASDTIAFTGAGAVLGAYSKNLQGGNYSLQVPLTCLDGLNLTFT